MQPPTAPTLSNEFGLALWKQVRAFGWLCLVAGMVFSHRASDFARGGLWPWGWGAAMVCALVAVLSLGRRIRTLLVGPAGAGGTAPATAPSAG
jgi:hypothetical protein